MADTKINWADKVWNPVTGCSRVSAGCQNCYAERMAHRLRGRYGYPPDDPFRVTLHPDKLEEPFHWRKPERIFVNSMSDLFHEDVPFEFIDRAFARMFDVQQHTYIILTKRPSRMLEYLSDDNPRYTARKVFDLTMGSAGKFDCDPYWPLDNVWIGVTVENRQTWDERVNLLKPIPAAIHFVSYEPARTSWRYRPNRN
jgi:protein gp37